jgi:hypothetical protein
MPKPVFGGSDSTQSSNSSGINAGQNQNYGFGVNGSYGTNQSGNMSQGSSVSTQGVYGEQSPYLQDVYGQAQNAFQTGMGEVEAMKPGVQNSMAQTLGQGQAGNANQMGGGFASGLAGQIGPNSYVDAMKGQVADDAMLLKQQNLGGLDARAAAAGMSGSSGYRDQVNDMSNQVDKNALNQMSQIGYNAHNQGIQNQMQLAGMMDQNQQFGVGNVNNMQQAAMNMFNPSMLGQQMAGQYAQTIGGPTVLSNSASNNMSSGFSNGFNAGMGMNGALGFGNNYGSNISSGSGVTDTHTGIVPGVAAGVAAAKA